MQEAVAAWARALGLPLAGDEVDRVAAALDAALAALARAQADAGDLAGVEPAFAFHPEVATRG